MQEQQAVLSVEEKVFAPVTPRPSVPFWDAPWIDPDLYDLLFTTSGAERLNTYLIVDATRRMSVTGIFDLDVAPVPVKCLFKGDAEESMATCAPYLVDLNLAETGPTSFHRSFFTDHWEHGTGILLRSAASMTEVWSHFRKFTRVKSVSGKSVFFRFWETNMMRDYFEAVAWLPERAKDLFCFKSGERIELIVGHSDRMGRACVVRPDHNALDGVAFSREVGQLYPQEEDALYRGVMRFHAKMLERQLPQKLVEDNPVKSEILVFNLVCRMREYGILRLDYLSALAEWDLRAGRPFEQSCPEMMAILPQSISEDEKFAILSELQTDFVI